MKFSEFQTAHNNMIDARQINDLGFARANKIGVTGLRTDFVHCRNLTALNLTSECRKPAAKRFCSGNDNDR